MTAPAAPARRSLSAEGPARAVAGILAAAALAAVFLLLAGRRLGAQGASYDELHQADGAFRWLDARSEDTCAAHVGRFCALNVSYSGAIKTNLYGLLLRLAGGRFDLVAWRLLGLAFAAAGLVAFAALVRGRIPAWSIAAAGLLFVSDGGVLLLSRFDAGPVALALLLRWAWLGVWLRGELAETPSPGNGFALGALFGLALFEKLSAVAWLPCVALAFAVRRERRSPAHLAAALAGLALGALPLGVVNAAAWLSSRALPSFADLERAGDYPRPGFGAVILGLFDQGIGRGVAARTLGIATPGTRWTEVAGIVAVAGLAAAALVAARRRSSPGGSTRAIARACAVAAASWGLVALALPLLPRATGPHHWIEATPFQYVACALALAALFTRAEDGAAVRARATRAVRVAGLSLLVLWIAGRAPALAAIERAISAGEFSSWYDPQVEDLGRFAAAHGGDSFFVATSWGIGTQVLCALGGRRDAFWQPIFDYRGATQLARVLARSGKGSVYALRWTVHEPPSLAGVAERIESDLARLPGWREVEPEPELRGLRTVAVRKFVRR